MPSSQLSSPPSSNPSTVFSIRIVSLDYYMAPPIPGLDFCECLSFKGRKVEQVPVIRIFGSTLAGQKACLHVHRALPYLYVPCSEFPTSNTGQMYTSTISYAIEKTLQLKGMCALKTRVHGCSLVRAKKLYGYHREEEYFLKIYLYNPSDVACVAALLLGGSILNKSIQPYESHIPFLLQFMVDYNLYGMAYLHTSNVQFRHPLPDEFVPKAHYSMDSDSALEGLASVSPISQADLCPREHGTCWPSSVPRQGSRSALANDNEAPNGMKTFYVKKQSICEVEGDSGIDDIVNQRAKLYCSLSQTGADMKMVQSLIPIWEEEHERSGVKNFVQSLDINKPLPRDVLKGMLNGLHEDVHRVACKVISENSGLECDEREEESKSFPHERHFPPSLEDDSGAELFLSFKRRNMPATLEGLSSVHSDGTSQRICEFSGPSYSSQKVNPFGMFDIREIKDSDAEALGLLSWLASSQVAEDFDLDNELDHEVILRPLLFSKSYEEVLEKAHLDYEIASQKECQDILDSLDYFQFGIPKENTALSREHSFSIRFPVANVIPQIDTSSDDRTHRSMASEVSVKRKMDAFSYIDEKDVAYRCIRNWRRDHQLSLPSSMKRKLEILGSYVDLSYLCPPGANDVTDAGSSPQNEISRSPEPPDREGREASSFMRDLIKRKDCYHAQQFEVHKGDLSGEMDVDTFLQMNKVDTQTNDSKEDVILLSEICSKSYIFKRRKPSTCSKSIILGSTQKCIGESYKVFQSAGWCEPSKESQNKHVDSQKTSSIRECGCTSVDQMQPGDSHEPGDSQNSNSHLAALKYTFLEESSTRQRNDACKTLSEAHQNNLPIKNQQESNCLNALDANKSIYGKSYRREQNVCTIRQNSPEWTNFIEMTVNQKPPIVDQLNDLCEDSQFLEACGIGKIKDPCLSDAGKQMLDFPPFFNKETEKMDHKSFLTEGYSGAVRDIPVHFQNNGSFSYMLAFAISPPSQYSVCKWLLGRAEHNMLLPSIESSKVDIDSGNVSESCSFYSHDEKASTYSRNFESMSAKLDSVDSPWNTDSTLLPIPSCTNNLFENLSGKHNTGAISRNILHSEVLETGKHCGASFDMQGEVHLSCHCDPSQISGPNEKSKPTPLSQIGFRDPGRTGGGQNLTLFSIEVLAESRGNLLSDPQFDAICLIAIAIKEDIDDNPKPYVLLHASDMRFVSRNNDGMSGCMLLFFPDERCLFHHLVEMFGMFDPDIILGWEIQGSSIGFLAERAAHLGIHLLKSISRIRSVESGQEVKVFSKLEKEVSTEFSSERSSNSISSDDALIKDEWGCNHASGIHVGGRIVLNVWRLMRSELKLSMYSIEAVVQEVLRRKIPCVPVRTLNKWFFSGSQTAHFRCIEYILLRANLNLQILNQLDLVNRTSELARVFGIDFFSVLSRGSQFRVESLLLRLAHSQNYLAISPGNQQVASQPAMECLPLILEPESGFYTDPVVVLDFQSLYPSMIIGYNLCYSTCLGRGSTSRGNVLGVSSLSPNPNFLLDLKEQMLITPNGIMFVPSEVRRGILPCLLDEILSTRLMVKKAMKDVLPSNQVLQRVLNARQLALKLIANVTYGYTAAGFSGRMPCAELADSIVQCGRRTLEMAISFINSHGTWNARVVYGDTDSMFVLLRGRSLEDAFMIGNEIALTITSMNPKPVMLKMEKVYYPCFLVTKKRYVGYSFETHNQKIPLFDAKGIETVRRDTCPAVAKTMEKSLRIILGLQDVSEVKSYLQRQWKRILSGKVSLQDFVFTKEVRLGTYSSRGSLPPAAIVAMKAMKVDPRSEPHYGERVPYVIIYGEPGGRLIDMVVDPQELLEINSPYRLNDIYYIKKQIIPALQRVLGLLGVDLNQWFSEIPYSVRPTVAKRQSCESSLMSAAHCFNVTKEASRKGYARNIIDKYYSSKHCVVCGNLVLMSTHVCDCCCIKGPLVASVLVGRTAKLEHDISHLSAICRHCGGGDWIIERGVKCTSLACSVFYERRKVQKELLSLSVVAQNFGFYPQCLPEGF